MYIATDWDHHFPVAKCALENGKNTAIEVPSAMNLDQCWQLIDLSEKSRKHCMILENCCYDYYELNALNMAQNGVLVKCFVQKVLTFTTSTSSGANIGTIPTIPTRKSWVGAWLTT